MILETVDMLILLNVNEKTLQKRKKKLEVNLYLSINSFKITIKQKKTELWTK